MKIAITGASGFIGRNLSGYLRDRGHRVIPLVRSAQKLEVLQASGLNPQVADVTERSALKTAFKDVEIVIHLAALFTNPEASWNDYYKVNVGGTRNVLEAAVECGVARVIHCSTVGVASGSGDPPFSERTPYSPAWGDKYEATKCEAEILALDFHRSERLPLVVIRPAQVYGPGDTRKAKFYRMVKRGIIVDPGKTKKHLIYIDDLCRAIELAMLYDKAEGEIFIIAGEKPIGLNELVALVARELDVSLPTIRLPAAPITWVCTATEAFCQFLKIKPPLYRRSMDFFTRSAHFDVSKAESQLDFRSEIDVPTGVAKTASWYKDHGLL